jgi:hypothetical protein
LKDSLLFKVTVKQTVSLESKLLPIQTVIPLQWEEGQLIYNSSKKEVVTCLWNITMKVVRVVSYR